MPPDKAILEELQELLDDDDTNIPAKATNRLLLAGIISLKNQLAEIRDTQISSADAIKKALEPVKKNPMFILGEFIQLHPKIATALIAFLLALSNIWFIDEFRIGVLTWLKVPTFIINLLH